MRLFPSAVLALAVLVTTGCGLSASPADNLQFKPPAGWQSSPGIMGFMQFWKSPANRNEVLMLFKSPKELKPEEVFADARLNDTLKGATIERRATIEICGHQPATYFQARGASSHGADERIEIVLTNVSGSSYLAMYVHPVGGLPNPMALAALREVCAKP